MKTQPVPINISIIGGYCRIDSIFISFSSHFCSSTNRGSYVLTIMIENLVYLSHVIIVMNRTNHVAIASVIVTLAVAAIVITAPNQFVKAQQPSQNASQFTANLTGESALPPITTNATGSAEFAVVGDGNTMTYKIDADNIDKVTDVFVAASSGGRFVDLVQLRSSVNEGVSGPISETLVEGNFTSSDFTGRLDKSDVRLGEVES